MPTATTTARQRVENATREAHLRALLVALNAWAREPHTPNLRRTVGVKLTKYQEAVERGLFTPSKRHVFRRDIGDSVSDESMMEVAALLKRKQPAMQIEETDAPPW